MTQYIVRRVLLMVPVALLVTIMVFILTQMLPGDPAIIVAGPDASKEYVETVRKEMGFDKPVVVQYGRWLGKLLHGDLGRSTRRQTASVVTLLKDRFPVTLELSVASLALSVVLSVPLGILSAIRRNSLWDVLATVGALAGVSTPRFVLGYLLILVFGVWAGWLPTAGYTPVTQSVWGNVKTMLLPCLTMGIVLTGTQMRVVRTSMLEVLSQDYIRTARAKGLAERSVIWVHALRNALIPLVTILGLQLATLLGGTVLVETVFGLPGLGKLMVDSIFARDMTVIQAVVLVMVLGFLVVNLLIDLLYSVIDPRIRYV